MLTGGSQGNSTGEVFRWQPVTPQKPEGATADGSARRSPPPLLSSPHIHPSPSPSRRWGGLSPNLTTDGTMASNSETTTHSGIRPSDSMAASLKFTRILEEDIVSLMGKLESADSWEGVSKAELIDILDRSLLGLSHWKLQTQLLQSQLLHINNKSEGNDMELDGNPSSLHNLAGRSAVSRGETLDSLVCPYGDCKLTCTDVDLRRDTPSGDPHAGNNGQSLELPYSNESRRYSTSSGFSRGPGSTPATSPPLYLSDEIHHNPNLLRLPASELMAMVQTKGLRRIPNQQLEKKKSGNNPDRN